MAIVTGTALSHGVARYAHLVQGETSQAEESAFCKTLADSILKDFCYKNAVREDILSYVRNDLGGDANNFCLPELDRDAITARLAEGMDDAAAPCGEKSGTQQPPDFPEGGCPCPAGWGAIALSNYRFPWERAFEMDMDLAIDPPGSAPQTHSGAVLSVMGERCACPVLSVLFTPEGSGESWGRFPGQKTAGTPVFLRNVYKLFTPNS